MQKNVLKNLSKFMKQYDVVIIGGGIAGICIAEILSRDKLKILIIKKNKNLISEASTSQHGWFHFGSLYAILEDNQTLKNMLNNLINIRKYYSHFNSMNLSFSKKKNFHLKAKKGWFNDEKINYYVAARNDRDLKDKNYLKYLKKVFNWEKKIKLFIARHKVFQSHLDMKNFTNTISKASYIDYSRKFIVKPNLKTANINPETHFKILGLDRTLNTEKITNNLVNSYLGNKGEIKFETSFKSYKLKKNYINVITNNGNFKSKYLINAMGRNILNVTKNKSIKNFVSPIGSFYPCLINENFVRLSPKKENTFNHLIHYHKNKKYSVVSSALSFPLKKNKLIPKEIIKKSFNRILKNNFSDLSKTQHKKIYNGIKTEFIDKQSRNYNYKIIEEDKNRKVYSVIPGKFTLSFSLAIDLYRKLFRKFPKKKSKIIKSKSKYINRITISKHNLLWN